ncbi:MAG: DnaB-like helicase C-terminal domain-containing protein [Paraclostridium sp.]
MEKKGASFKKRTKALKNKLISENEESNILSDNNIMPDIMISKLCDARNIILGHMLRGCNEASKIIDVVTDNFFVNEADIIIYNIIKNNIDKFTDDGDNLCARIMAHITSDNKHYFGYGVMDYLVKLLVHGGQGSFEEAINIVLNFISIKKIVGFCKALENKMKSIDLCVRKHELRFHVDRYADYIYQSLAEGDIVLDGSFKTMGQILAASESDKTFLDEIMDRHALFQIHGCKKYEYSTGILELDDILGGIQQGLIILAGRPSMGKTAFAIYMARYLSIQSGARIGIISLEMSSFQLVERMLSLETKIPLINIRDGSFDPQNHSIIRHAIDKMQSYKILFNDKAVMSIEEIMCAIRRMVKHCGIKIIILDYLQLIGVQDAENRNIAISQITRELKIMCINYDICIICLSQMNRQADNISGHKPQLSHLRDSGAIEQDADIVLMLNRLSYYDSNANKDEIEIHVAKNRHGSTGVVMAYYDKAIGYFSDLEKQSIYIAPETKKRKISSWDEVLQKK